MKLLLNVVLEKLEKKINRQIIVDDSIKLDDLCEFIIISMNGREIPIYELEYNETTYFPNNFQESDNDKRMQNLRLRDLKLEKKKCFYLNYNFENYYVFKVIVDDIYESDFNSEEFKVISGQGTGILDSMPIFFLNVENLQRKNIDKYLPKDIQEYLKKEFVVTEINNEINKYREDKKDLIKPKHYIMNISLYGFEQEIKRKILVNSNILVDDFCRKVIVSMNGDLSHSYALKIGKEFLSEYYYNKYLLYLNLKEKQKFKIIYDYGDNWIFNITINKIISGFNENNFTVISGKGYGIIDDCGGIMVLYDILRGNDTSWGEYDINEFNLEKCNENVKENI